LELGRSLVVAALKKGTSSDVPFYLYREFPLGFEKMTDALFEAILT